MSLVHNHHEQPFPRGALWFVAIVITFTLMSAAAIRLGYSVLATTLDKGHGLREAFILDGDGYCWVPGRPVEQ